MATDVVMPQMGESITEGTLTKWLKKPGDTVARDEPLFEISTDKVDAEIPSPTAGVLGAIKVEEGATVTVGTIVCAIEEAGTAGSSAAPAAPAATTKEETVTPAAVTTAAKDEAVAAPAPEVAAGPGTEVPMPQMGESITEGTLTKWLKKVGDTVARDEPIFEISTDKVDAEIPSPIAGTLTEIKVQEGQTRRRRQMFRSLRRQLLQRRPLLARHRAPRRWFARSRAKTMSTWRVFQVQALQAASPSRTSWVILKAHLLLHQFFLPPRQLQPQHPSLQHLPLRSPRQHLASSFRCPRCVALSPSAWWNRRPPARMSTRSSRWT
jgi:biotin carboxyl carrier protein